MNTAEVRELIIEECDRVLGLSIERHSLTGMTYVQIFSKGCDTLIQIDKELEMWKRYQGVDGHPSTDRLLQLLFELIWRQGNNSRECVCEAIKTMLLKKNTKYGNSVFEPIGIFAQCSADILIRARIDDKLARIKNLGGLTKDIDEDTLLDLIGYLILLRVLERFIKGHV